MYLFRGILKLDPHLREKIGTNQFFWDQINAHELVQADLDQINKDGWNRRKFSSFSSPGDVNIRKKEFH